MSSDSIWASQGSFRSSQLPTVPSMLFQSSNQSSRDSLSNNNEYGRGNNTPNDNDEPRPSQGQSPPFNCYALHKNGQSYLFADDDGVLIKKDFSSSIPKSVNKALQYTGKSLIREDARYS